MVVRDEGGGDGHPPATASSPSFLGGLRGASPGINPLSLATAQATKVADGMVQGHDPRLKQQSLQALFEKSSCRSSRPTWHTRGHRSRPRVWLPRGRHRRQVALRHRRSGYEAGAARGRHGGGSEADQGGRPPWSCRRKRSSSSIRKLSWSGCATSRLSEATSTGSRPSSLPLWWWKGSTVAVGGVHAALRRERRRGGRR